MIKECSVCLLSIGGIKASFIAIPQWFRLFSFSFLDCEAEMRVMLHKKEMKRIDRWVSLQRRRFHDEFDDEDQEDDDEEEAEEEKEEEEDFDEDSLKAHFQHFGQVEHVFITWEENMVSVPHYQI